MITSMIVAADLDDCIGDGGTIPWHLPADLKRFKELTMGHVCIVGSKTQASIVAAIGKHLPGRKTIIVSRSATHQAPALVVSDPHSALAIALVCEAENGGDEVFIIGGTQIYKALLPEVDRIYLTRVETRINGDTYLPADWLHGFERTRGEGHVDLDVPLAYSFYTYERRGNGEKG